MTLPTDPDPYLLNGIEHHIQILREFKWKSWLKRHGKEHNYKFSKDERRH